MMTKLGQKSSVNDVVVYIVNLMSKNRKLGKLTLTLTSGEVHKEMGYKNAHPTVCAAMKKCMRSTDLLLNDTPSGESSTIEIKYNL